MSRLSANSEDTGMSQVFTNIKFNCLSTYLESLQQKRLTNTWKSDCLKLLYTTEYTNTCFNSFI